MDTSMNLDQILNLAERLEIYSGFQSDTVDVTILPSEAAFLAQMLKTVTGGTRPSIPDQNGWVTGWPPKYENMSEGDEVLFVDKDHDVDIAKLDEDGDWIAVNMDNPSETRTLGWRPFDAPF